MSSAHCGTTAFPRHRNRSTRLGIPSSTPQTGDRAAHHPGLPRLSASFHCELVSQGYDSLSCCVPLSSLPRLAWVAAQALRGRLFRRNWDPPPLFRESWTGGVGRRLPGGCPPTVRPVFGCAPVPSLAVGVGSIPFLAIDWRLCRTGPCRPPPPRRGSIRNSLPRVWATMNSRRRRWGAPMSAADTVRHAASNPRVARSPSTLTSPAVARPGTFSTMTYRGRMMRMARANSLHNPLRVPSCRPARFPATLTSWHGNPPQITSTRSIHSLQSIWVTSPRFGTCGQCFARTRHA
jgi:hypothetical protein